MWFDLKGDARLGPCATEGCGGQPTSRLEADGTGSNYCSGCRSKIEQSRTVHDPFLNKDVQVSSRLTDRLRGRYANGPTMANGEPEFGWREFPTPPIQHDAATEIERLQAIEKAAWDYFNHAVQDEADDRENCVSDEQHRLAYELKNALDFDNPRR